MDLPMGHIHNPTTHPPLLNITTQLPKAQQNSPHEKLWPQHPKDPGLPTPTFCSLVANSTKPMPLISPVSRSVGSRTFFTSP